MAGETGIETAEAADVNTLKPIVINKMHYNYRMPYPDGPGGAELSRSKGQEKGFYEIRSQISQ